VAKYPSLKGARGRKPHQPLAMIKALILKEIMQIPSKRKLAEFLKKNEYWCRKCGFKKPPHHDSFSKFIKRLGRDTFIEIFEELVKSLRRAGVLSGDIMAIDSTLIKAYSRPKEGREPSDPDAKWGINLSKNGSSATRYI